VIYTLTLNPSLDRELTVPAITFDEVLRATRLRIDYGGKGLNVSRMLAVLGAESIAMGLAGGMTGECLLAGLAAAGITTDFVSIGGETRTNVSIVTAGYDRRIKVNETGPSITADELSALRQRVRERAEPGDLWVMSGSLPPGIPPTVYADLIRDMQDAGSRVILDTSGDALHHGCAARPFLVKPNAAEAGELTGRRVTTVTEAVAAARAVKGVSHVVVSMGKAGAVLVHDGCAWIVSAPAVQERNPIGAGDALVAGLAWGLHEARSPLDSLQWGVACGAATASCPATEVGSRDAVVQLLDEVVVRAVNESA
jgi:1-phosphofructokinase family hexose kinase